MPFYPSLRDYKDKTQRVKVINNILSLKKELGSQVPKKKLESNLLIATWNIREFGKNAKAKRLKECLFYIAEIIASFDLVAVQEVGDDLTDLYALMKILGPDWDYIITDITEGTSGNGERLAFLYDKRKVLFRKMAGEIVLPPAKSRDTKQIARTPFIVAFQSGWFKFFIITVHIYYGKDTVSSPEFKRRVEEIGAVGRFLKKRSVKDKANYILLGDFNITGTGKNDVTMSALTGGGFKIPDQLAALTNSNNDKTNADRSKPYDRIAYIDQKGFMEFEKEENSAGVFDYFKVVFLDGDKDYYKRDMAQCKLKTFKEWKTYQMSDHLPLWIEFKVDFSNAYLEKLKSEEYNELKSRL